MFNNIVCSFFSSPQSLKDVIVKLQMKLSNETHVYHGGESLKARTHLRLSSHLYNYT